jgi:hypothetical protein
MILKCCPSVIRDAPAGLRKAIKIAYPPGNQVETK